MVASKAQSPHRRGGSSTSKAASRTGAAGSSGEMLDDIRTQTARLAESVKSAARDLADDAARKATGVTRAVKEGAGELVAEQKERAAARVERLGSAIGQAARVLRAGRIDKAAEYAEAAAAGVEGTAKYLRESDLPALLDNAADVARQYPLAFLGAMFVAGVGIARFVKAADADGPSEAAAARGRSRSRNGRRGSQHKRR